MKFENGLWLIENTYVNAINIKSNKSKMRTTSNMSATHWQYWQYD